MKRAGNHNGFTIAELLIVVVVIAILAAITIVSYNGITQRAFTASIQTEMRGTLQKLESFKAVNGSAPTNTIGQLTAAGISITKSNYDQTANNFLYCVNLTTNEVGIAALAKNGTTYAIATNRAFSTYTSFTLANYSGTCNDLTGSGSALYGFFTGAWRSWVGSN